MTFRRGVTGGLSLGDVTSYFFSPVWITEPKGWRGEEARARFCGAWGGRLVETWSAHGQVWDQAFSFWMSSVLLPLLEASPITNHKHCWNCVGEPCFTV